MNSEKWERAKQLYEAALKCRHDERSQFLAGNCRGDDELRREVESLLACSDEAASFLEKPAIGEMAEVIVGQRSLIGQKLLQYQIIELLGAGGMGEVYLAEDTRLKRRIALKILPASLSNDKTSVRRFEQEAYAASALNHPNILTVHEFGEKDGMNFIASEYVEGKTLRASLKDGQTPALSQTLDIGCQVAAALNAAHSSGIVHRDIKPENIMIRDDGLVKVLDFGLAKLVLKADTVSAEDETLFQTTPGMIMGTAAYMSPEQARGQETDARTDIWSFGGVLYEMLAGKPAFKGETASDTIAAILAREPGMIDRDLPAELTRILRKALKKDRAERYQSVKDLLVDLNALNYKLQISPSRGTGDGGSAPGRLETGAIEDRTGSGVNATSVSERTWRPNRKLIAAGVFSLLIVGTIIWRVIPQNRNQTSPNILASLRVRQLISWDGEAGEDDARARFSPNGTMIAYSRTTNGQKNIWTKQVPEGKPSPITDGKWDYYNPIWSPDGQRLAFISNRDNQNAIWAMPFSGGELTSIRAMESANINLLTWSRNGEKIYYQQGDSQGGLNIFALDLSSKQVTQLTNFDSANQAQFLSVSPDEDRIAYSAGPNERLHIFIMPIGGGRAVQVTNDEASDEYPLWLPDGKRIIYSSKRDGVFQTCIAYLEESRTEQLNLGVSDTLISDVAQDGGRILFQQSRVESDLWQVRSGEKTETQITFESGIELWPDISADGNSIVFQAANESKHLLEGTIRIRSLDDTQQINIASNGFSPSFSPDGRSVAFLRDANKLINLWTIGRNGADERQLTTDGVRFSGFSLTPYNRVQPSDYSWSPDSSNLIYCAKKDGVWNVWQVAAIGTGVPRQITNNTDENIRFYGPMFAPDGKRIAYTSNLVKASPGAVPTTDIYVWTGENSTKLLSPASVVKLIGWERSGGGLLVALPEGDGLGKPVRVRLSFISPDGRTSDLVPIEAAYFNNIQLSPDGQRIALATRDGGKDNIRVISSRGGENTRVTANVDPTTYLAGVSWAPDGKSIYFSKQKQVGTISMIENFK